MKFLADMDIAHSTVAFLRTHGYHVVHLRDLETGALVSVTERGIRIRVLPVETDKDNGTIDAMRFATCCS
jgi:hypothetical protein